MDKMRRGECRRRFRRRVDDRDRVGQGESPGV